MENPNLSQISKERFKFGERSLTLLDFFEITTLQRLANKFNSKTNLELFFGLRELIRYLYLAAHSPHGVFFPGSIFLDDLWHALILETADYRNFCNKLLPGSFIDHTGIKYQDYCKIKTPSELHLEQLSWLTSYVHNFGKVSEESCFFLPLITALMKRLNINLESLNHLAESLFIATQNAEYAQNERFDLEIFIEEIIRTQAQDIDENSELLKKILLDILRGVESTQEGLINRPLLLSNDDLEAIFGASTALGFTIWQHLAAVERLSYYSDWQNKNLEIWRNLSYGHMLCGLATTHLASPGPPILKGFEVEGGFQLNGEVPWVSGYGIFELLLVGFESENEILYALIDYPRRNTEHESSNFRISTHDLACMNATSTVKIEVNKFYVCSDQIIFRRKKCDLIAPRKSRYYLPDLGIAKFALKYCSEIIAKQKEHPRSIIVAKGILEIQLRINALKYKGTMSEVIEDNDIINLQKDEVIRDAVRLLSIASGGNGLLKGGVLSRLQKELLLLDAIIQSPKLIEMKIKKVSHG